MFQKKYVQKISAIITAIGMVTTMTSYNMARASEVEFNGSDTLVNYDTNANDLLENYDEDSELCRKLQLEYDSSTTGLSEEKEKELNAMGIFDSDIELLGEETMDKIEDAYSYSISVMYYEENTKDGSLEEMSPSGVDELIGDVYGEELQEAEEAQVSGLDKMLSGTIFGAVKASAKSKSLVKKSASGKVKQMLAFIQRKKGGKVNVAYTCTWLQEPKCRKTDFLFLGVKDARCLTDTWEALHTCKYADGINKYENFKEERKNYRAASPYGMAVDYSFFPNRAAGIENESFVLKFDCEPGKKKIYATGLYYHCKNEAKLSLGLGIGLTIGADGLSFGPSASGAGSVEDVYSIVTNNPSTYFDTK
ncbi:MAG: hypothetical protein NC347_15215 [Clostridium sp.]|nr:hypothetical protein [Clostridium sp.]